MADLCSGFVWRICMADLYGGFVWRFCVADLYGGFIWRICMTDLYSGFVWRVCMATLCGGFIWRFLVGGFWRVDRRYQCASAEVLMFIFPFPSPGEWLKRMMNWKTARLYMQSRPRLH